jgi:hypothetical protein
MHHFIRHSPDDEDLIAVLAQLFLFGNAVYQLPFDNLTALIEHRPAAVTRLNRRIVGDQPGDRAAAPDAKRKGAGGRPILLSNGGAGTKLFSAIVWRNLWLFDSGGITLKTLPDQISTTRGGHFDVEGGGIIGTRITHAKVKELQLYVVLS